MGFDAKSQSDTSLAQLETGLLSTDPGAARALEAALRAGARTPADFARLVAQFPSSGKTIMLALQRQYGTKFVQEVMKAATSETGSGATRAPAVNTRESAISTATAPPNNDHVPEHRGIVDTASSSSADLARPTGKQTEHKGTGAASKLHPTSQSATVLDPSDAHQVLYAAYNAITGKKPVLDFKITSQNSVYVRAIDKLYEVASGKSKTGEALTAAQKYSLFTQARDALSGLVPVCEKGMADTVDFVEQYYIPIINDMTSSVSYAAADERVSNAVIAGPGVVELPPDSEPHEQARALQPQIRKFDKTTSAIVEQLARMRDLKIEHEAEKMFEEGEKGGRFGSLKELGNALMLADAWLTFTDAEFREHLAEVQGMWQGISTYTEFVKAVLEVMAGGTGVICSISALIARSAGDLELAAQASGAARLATMGKLGSVIAALEIAHGVSVLLDSHASQEQKLEAGGDVAIGGAFLGGKLVRGAEFGAAASTAAMAGYFELQWAISAYVGSVVGFDTAAMREVYKTLTDYGGRLQSRGDQLIKAHALATQETDPERRDALTRVEHNAIMDAARTLDSFIAKCAPKGNSDNADSVQMRDFGDPGQFNVMQELLYTPLAGFQNAHTEDAVIAGVGVALEKIAWAQTHAKELLITEINHGSLKDAEAAAGAEAAKKKNGDEGEGE